MCRLKEVCSQELKGWFLFPLVAKWGQSPALITAFIHPPLHSPLTVLYTPPPPLGCCFRLSLSISLLLNFFLFLKHPHLICPFHFLSLHSLSPSFSSLPSFQIPPRHLSLHLTTSSTFSSSLVFCPSSHVLMSVSSP